MIVGSFSLIFIPKCMMWNITFHLFVVLRITYFFLPLLLQLIYPPAFISQGNLSSIRGPAPISGIMDLAMVSVDKKSKIRACTFEQV